MLVKRSMEQWRLCYPRLARDRNTRPPLYEGLTVAKDHLSPPANGPKTNAQHSTVPPEEVCLVARLHAPLSRPLVWRSSCGLFSNVLSFCFHVNSPPIRDSKETLSSPLQCNFRQCSQRVEEVERKNCPLVDPEKIAVHHPPCQI